MEKDDIQALSYALEQTDELVELFESVLKQEPVKPYRRKDFTPVAEKLTAKPEETVESPSDERFSMNLSRLRECCSNCTRCRLSKTRKNVVFGEGCTDYPDVMVIGEGPGEVEDNTGRPFVGPAGQYLDKWLAPISLSRDKNVYIANIVKCRPPQNRDPLPDETEVCRAFLEQQISQIKPRAILCLGKPASALLTGKKDVPIGTLRGKFFMYKNCIPMICTYHPAAVLRDQSLKVPVWEDLKKLARALNLEIVKGK